MNIKNNINLLLKYIKKNNYKGYDPYDLKGLYWYINLENNSLRTELDNLNNKYPEELREIFKIKPKINNKALALFALSYLNLYETTNDKKYFKKAIKLAKQLLNKANKNYSGLCWGYPFDWKSGNYIFKENTPSIVVTTTIAKVFIKLYKITKKEKYLNSCKSIVKFITKDLNQTNIKNTICFSYTPHDNYQIHNANLMGAGFLSEMGIILKNKELLQLARKSTYFSINQQNNDGSLYYYGNNSSKIAPQHLDIYHSGFEIRSLINLYKNLKNKKIKISFLKYLNFFTTQYILENKIPKLAPKIKNYPVDIVDIHGLAEVLLTLNASIKYYPRNKQLLKNIYKWGIENMQRKDGAFKYRWIRNNNTVSAINISYMRWGQAWMLFALTDLYKNK